MQVNLTERLVLATTDDGSNNNSTTTTGDPQRARHYYDLVSVVVHIGAAHDEGHFVCVVRCGPPGSAADSAWTLFDDGRKPCRLADFDAVQRRYASHDWVFALSYSRYVRQMLRCQARRLVLLAPL